MSELNITSEADLIVWLHTIENNNLHVPYAFLVKENSVLFFLTLEKQVQ